ncbi:hypothetical protein [Arthrobacter sp. ISL-5]|uniref:hypothetical protein n=1 Tax=Arthrobacter sp. ISL-5 TaxID=2819111 RepID=UPI001BE8B61B|nr:hypothetical protein [Arthrobacter sp. ISL-5]MBT2555836.1 hypothetical protein [Arthrobacter sp. ISL-5]
MAATPDTFHASITVLTIDGMMITKDVAKQLDELRFDDWENFEPIGRVRTGISYVNEGIELLGRHKETGALVRMWHVTITHRVMRIDADGRTFFEKPAPETPQDTCATHLRTSTANSRCWPCQRQASPDVRANRILPRRRITPHHPLASGNARCTHPPSGLLRLRPHRLQQPREGHPMNAPCAGKGTLP